MLTRKSLSFFTLRNYELVKVFLLLAITVWIAHFWYSPSFGLYEDDYSRIPRAIETTWPELWNLIVSMGFTDGRPFHHSLIFLFSFLGFKLGGLPTVYWIAYFIFTLNAFLFYLLLKRLFNQEFFTVPGALAFCLFPADTTSTWMTVSFGLQPSLTLLLLAFHSYLSDRKKLSYLISFGILLSYETLFPLFLAAPLLNQQWDSKLKREFLRHILIFVTLLLFTVIIRKIMGETRVSELHFFSALRVCLRLMLYGPIVSMGMFLYRPIETLLLWDFRNGSTQNIPWSVAKNIFVGFLPLCFAGLMYVVSQLKLKTSGDSLLSTITVKSRVFLLEVPQFFKDIAKLSLLGVIMLILAYPFALTMDPTTISGRDSRVHLPAMIGASILLACVCSNILFIANAYEKKRLANVSLAIYFTLLIGFGLIVQNDYKTSWQHQRAFWTDVIRLCPDLTDGTRIVVEDIGLRRTKYITANTWPSFSILPNIFQFPDNWKVPPRLFLLQPGGENKIISNGDLIDLNSSGVMGAESDVELTVESSNAIFLEIKNGKLVRKSDSLIIDGQVLPLKKVSDSELPPLKKGPLYDYLIMSPEEETVDYILN